MNIASIGLAILLGLISVYATAAVEDIGGFGKHLVPDSSKIAAVPEAVGAPSDAEGAPIHPANHPANDPPLDVFHEEGGKARQTTGRVPGDHVSDGGNLSGRHASTGIAPGYEKDDPHHENSADNLPIATGGLRGGGIASAKNPLADTLATLPASIKSEEDISRLSKGLDDARAIIAQSFEDFESKNDYQGLESFPPLIGDLPQLKAVLYQMNGIIPTISEALSDLNDSFPAESEEREKHMASRGRWLENDIGGHARASRHEYPESKHSTYAHAESKTKPRSSRSYQTSDASNEVLRQYIPHSLKSLAHIFGAEFLEDINGKGQGRGRRRLVTDDADNLCAAPCNDPSCSCERLRSCALNLTMSEYAVLFSQGSITEDGEIKADVNFFDASRLYQKIKGDQGIIALARDLDVDNQDKCDDLLRQFHVPCQAGMTGCVGTTDQSRFLSIDEVCDAIGSTEDLTFSDIAKVFDPKLDDDDMCGEIFPDNYYLRMRSDPANDISARLKSFSTYYDPIADDMENIIADGRLDNCLLDSNKCILRTKKHSNEVVGFMNTCDIRRCTMWDGLTANCCDHCCFQMALVDGKPFIPWIKQRIDTTVQKYVDDWISCAAGPQCDPESRASHAACDEFLTCTNEIWRAGNSASYTPNKYPFGPNIYNGFNDWADVWWPDAWIWDRDPDHGVALPRLLENAANTGGDDDGTFSYALDGMHDVSLPFVYKDNNGKALMISDGFDKKFVFKKEYTFQLPTACAASKISGSDNTKCDDSKTLLFGKEASVGHICSIAKAVGQDPGQMPGHCCLDNVITSNKFGEKYDCENGWSSCQNPGPFISRFSPGACDQVGGTWCRAPCDKLMACINDLRGERNFCRASAFALAQAGNFTPESNPVDCDVHLELECVSQDGLPCEDFVVNPASTPPVTSQGNVSLPTSNQSSFDNTSAFIYTTSTAPNLEESEQMAALECVPATFNYTFSVSNAGSHCMEILKFSQLRDGIQTDLTHVLVNAGLDLKVCPYHGDKMFRFSETMRVCAGRPFKSAFVVESENEEYDSAFSDFTAGLVISEPDDEEQCQYAREALMFDPAHVDDQEICDHLADMKCGLRPFRSRLLGDYEELADIPEFEDFDFEGFEPNDELSFQHVQSIEIKKEVKLPYKKSHIKALAGAFAVAKGGADFWYGYAMRTQSYECPIVVAGGVGDSSICVALKAKLLLKLWLLNTAGAVLTFVANLAYSRVAAGDVEAHEAATYAKQLHRNVRKLNAAMTGNFNIINSNMWKQHSEVRRTLAEQHHIVANLLTDQHNSVGEQLTTQHVVLNDNLGTLQNNLQLKHGEIMGLIESKAGEVQETCMSSILNSTRFLKEQIVMSARVLEGYMRDEIQATTDSIQLIVEEMQTTNNKMAENLSTAMGLQIDAKCVQRPRIKSGSGSNKPIVMAFMVYTKSHGVPTEGIIDSVDVVFHDKNGEIKSQAASVTATTPLPKGSGRQHVSISIDTDKNSMRNMNDILIVDIFVKNSSGTLTSQASILPCFLS